MTSEDYIPLAEDTNVTRLRANVSFLWHMLHDIEQLSAMAKENDKWFRKNVEQLIYNRFERIDEENGILVVVPQRGGN